MSNETLTHAASNSANEVEGYDFGKPASAHSPLSLEELRRLEESTGWTDADLEVLRRHRSIFEDHAEEMVGSWRSVIGSQPHLARLFAKPEGTPDENYKKEVKARFVQWVKDVALRPHDRAWLDYQEEIGLRHTPAKKNVTDGAHTPNVVPLRYLFAFTSVILITTRDFFRSQGVTGDELVRLQDAWTKAVILHVTLWSRPYATDGLW